MATLISHIPAGLTTEQYTLLLLRVRIEELTRKIATGEFDIEWVDADRSRSPEPVYDKDGKRVNTKEVRAKERLVEERANLIEMALAIYPQWRPPTDWAPGQRKKIRKIWIPQDRHPEYNFIGLIIGPRGNTQKRLERETGCKISIRGKGSLKDGKVGKVIGGEDEPLHCHIQADNDIQLSKAARLIQDLLTPVEEDRNEHKRKQLMELAEINGTVKAQQSMWIVPTDERSFDLANVRCAICGDRSHPTSDCALKGKINPVGATDKESIDKEYSKFLEEIGENPQNQNEKFDEFAEFQRAIGVDKFVSKETIASAIPYNQISQPQFQQQQQQQQPWQQPNVPWQQPYGMPNAPQGMNPWQMYPPQQPHQQ